MSAPEIRLKFVCLSTTTIVVGQASYDVKTNRIHDAGMKYSIFSRALCLDFERSGESPTFDHDIYYNVWPTQYQLLYLWTYEWSVPKCQKLAQVHTHL